METTAGPSSREIKSVILRDDESIEEFATEISNNLNEPNKSLIQKISNALGREKTLQFYNETINVEKNGGLYYQSGSRRKTPGGVFFYLIYHDKTLPSDTIRKLFHDDVRRNDRIKKNEAKLRRRKQNEELKQRLIKEGLLNLIGKR